MEEEDEWNKIAEERLLDRLAGNDTSYNDVLLPVIIQNIQKDSDKKVKILDFGCGTGELTYEISKFNNKTIGLDISINSIKLAKKYFLNSNLTFTNNSIFELSDDNFDIIVANMSLMDTEHLKENVEELYKKIKNKGRFLVIITHPAFWPIYWGYNDENFNYLIESKITRTYRTSNKIFDGFVTSHYHRPISNYINLFCQLNFKIIKIEELRNPRDKNWYSRFLYFELEK